MISLIEYFGLTFINDFHLLDSVLISVFPSKVIFSISHISEDKHNVMVSLFVLFCISFTLIPLIHSYTACHLNLQSRIQSSLSKDDVVVFQIKLKTILKYRTHYFILENGTVHSTLPQIVRYIEIIILFRIRSFNTSLLFFCQNKQFS